MRKGNARSATIASRALGRSWKDRFMLPTSGVPRKGPERDRVRRPRRGRDALPVSPFTVIKGEGLDRGCCGSADSDALEREDCHLRHRLPDPEDDPWLAERLLAIGGALRTQGRG